MIILEFKDKNVAWLKYDDCHRRECGRDALKWFVNFAYKKELNDKKWNLVA